MAGFLRNKQIEIGYRKVNPCSACAQRGANRWCSLNLMHVKSDHTCDLFQPKTLYTKDSSEPKKNETQGLQGQSSLLETTCRGAGSPVGQ